MSELKYQFKMGKDVCSVYDDHIFYSFNFLGIHNDYVYPYLNIKYISFSKSKSILSTNDLRISTSDIKSTMLISISHDDTEMAVMAFDYIQERMKALQSFNCDAGESTLGSSSNVTDVPSVVAAASEVKALKELLDIGAITQEEFDAKKKQLLGL